MTAPKAHANINNLVISAIVNGLYRFSSEKDALALLNSLKDKFLISKKYERFPNEIVLWIKGYDLAKSYKGNYASLTVFEEKSVWHIKCKTLPIDVKFHPQRELVKQQHPNWGHPVLRAVKKKKEYENKEDANAELIQLQQDFPQASIPAIDRLYIMIYEKGEKGGRVDKYILELKPLENGKFCITHKLNIPKPKPPSPAKPQIAQGKFTAKILEKRKKKVK